MSNGRKGPAVSRANGLTKDDRAVLQGAAEWEVRGGYVTPGSPRGAIAFRRLVKAGLLELTGWEGPTVDTRAGYRLTEAGRLALNGC